MVCKAEVGPGTEGDCQPLKPLSSWTAGRREPRSPTRLCQTDGESQLQGSP